MAFSCPMSHRRVDSRMARTVSFQVAIFITLFLYTHSFSLAVIVLFDFFMRLMRKETFSPFSKIGKIILDTFKIEPKFCDELPKRFALYLGTITIFLIVFFYLTDIYFDFGMLITYMLSILLIFLTLLEALLGFCVGCKIYYILQLIKGVFNNGRNFK